MNSQSSAPNSPAAPMDIPQASASPTRARSGSLSGLLSSFSLPKSPSSVSTQLPPLDQSRGREGSLSSSSISEESPATPRDVPVNKGAYGKGYTLRNNVFDNDSSTKFLREERDEPSDFVGFLGSPRSAAYHAHTRRASWSSRGPTSAPSAPGAEFGTSPPPSIMGWLQGLNGSPTSKAAPLPPLDTSPPPAVAKQPQDANTNSPASSNLGNLFRRMSLGSPSNMSPISPTDKAATPPAMEAERGRESSVARRKSVPRKLSPTCAPKSMSGRSTANSRLLMSRSERMLRGAYNDLS